MQDGQFPKATTKVDGTFRLYLLAALPLIPVVLVWGVPLCLPVELPPELPQAQTTINPNLAPWQELAVLPMIGEGKARAIVAYRNTWDRGPESRRPPFTSPQDLTKVPGVGPKTVAKLAPHLRFSPR